MNPDDELTLAQIDAAIGAAEAELSLAETEWNRAYRDYSAAATRKSITSDKLDALREVRRCMVQAKEQP